MPLTAEQYHSDLIDQPFTLMPSTNLIKHTLILKMTTTLIVQGRQLLSTAVLLRTIKEQNHL